MGGDGMASYLQFLRGEWLRLKDKDTTVPDFSVAQLSVLRRWMRQEAPKRYKYCFMGRPEANNPWAPQTYAYDPDVILIGLREIHEPLTWILQVAKEAGFGKSQRKKVKRRKKK